MPNPVFTYTLIYVCNFATIYNISIYCIFGLVWFYGISIIAGYQIPNPVLIYILDIRFVN